MTTRVRFVRLVPLALAIAVVAAAGVTSGRPAAAEPRPVLPFRAFVPSMATDGAADEDSAPQEVVVARLSQHLDSGLVVSGEVVNLGVSPVNHVQVRVSVSHGEATTTYSTESRVATLAPGARGVFQVFIGSNSLASSFAADVIGYGLAEETPSVMVSDISGPYPFQIGPPDPKTNVIPYSTTLDRLVGKVMNTGTERLTELEVVVAIYDGNGDIVLVTNGMVTSVPFQEAGQSPVLEPGTTGDFVVGIPKGVMLTLSGTPTIVGFLNAVVAN